MDLKDTKKDMQKGWITLHLKDGTNVKGRIREACEGVAALRVGNDLVTVSEENVSKVVFHDAFSGE